MGNSDKKHFLGSKGISDAQTGKQIGKYIFTFFSNIEEKRNEILDVDIVLNSETAVELEFLQKYPESSDSNEYYEVQTTATEQHLNIETVNRYMIPTAILNTKQMVYCSAFSFELSIFDNVVAFNEFFGFGSTGVKVGSTDLTVQGLSETFLSPGGFSTNKEAQGEMPWSFVVGTVKSERIPVK